jgi:integrase
MIYKRGRIYWYRFTFEGAEIRESTKQTNDKTARAMESAHRTRLAKLAKEKDEARERLGCSGVTTCHECERLFNVEKALRKGENVFCSPKCAGQWGRARSMPTLVEFLADRFLPHVQIALKAKPKTVQYYRQGIRMLERSSVSRLRLDELTGEHAGRFAAENETLSASGVNMGLRTMRRALNLAYSWGAIEKPVKVALATGEVQRERILTQHETAIYLAHCPQPWKDAAIIMLDEGTRPGEVFVLRWEDVALGGDGVGFIKITDGKSKAARRTLPITPRVANLLEARLEAQGRPSEGFVFPTKGKDGHLEVQTAKRQHLAALRGSKLKPFVPYILRHTALTRLSVAARGDVFALAKIAGHSSIVITQKYVKPEAETIGAVFSRLSAGG